MKTIKILLTVLLAVFLTVVTASAQFDPVPPMDPFAPPDPVAPPPPTKGGGGYYNPGGGPYSPGGDAGSGYYSPVPEPSTLILLGVGLAAGGVYSFVRRQKSRERV